MKRFKKIAALLLACGLLTAMPLTAFAASGISASEQKILDKAAAIRNMYTLTAQQKKTFDNAIASARSYLEANDLSDSQVDAVLGAIDSAAAAVKTICPDGDLTRLSSADKQTLAAKVASALQAGANAAGIKITIHSDGTFAFTDSKGNPAVSTGAAVKATGVTAGTTAAVVAALTVVLGGCALIAKRKKMFA